MTSDATAEIDYRWSVEMIHPGGSTVGVDSAFFSHPSQDKKNGGLSRLDLPEQYFQHQVNKNHPKKIKIDSTKLVEICNIKVGSE